jgi:beta-1,4-glucosyltransferase
MTASEGQGRVRIGGFAIEDCDFERAKRRIFAGLDEGSRRAVFFANTHFIVTCQPLRAAIANNPSVFVLNDGIGMSLARRLLRKGRFIENLNGTDFIPRLLRESGRPLRLYLLGSTKASVEGAASDFGRVAQIEIAGTCDGYSFWLRDADVIKEINAAKPHMLLVALGCPLQERWIIDNFERLNVPLVFGVGALFDFVSGQQLRAPGFMRTFGFEWLYRLWREPGRLIYRYSIELMSFFWIVLRSRKARA